MVGPDGRGWAVELRVLGPLEVWSRGQRVRVGGARTRRLLTALALEADRAVPVHRLVDVLWDDDPPATATRQVQNTAAALRRLLVDAAGGRAPADLLITDGPGYRLTSDGVELDLQVFTDRLALARDAVAARETAKAIEELRFALGLWRGPALAGIGSRVLAAAAVELDERRLGALEECIELELALGRHRNLVGELSAVVAEHPLRERFTAQLMLALYRNGRAGDALGAYQRLRARLADELGLDTSLELQRLESAILRADPSLGLPGEQPNPVVTSPVAAPRQLPADTAAFVGRADHLAELEALRPTETGEQARAAVITAIDGTAGIGKTTLAVHVAHRIAGDFPDGQLYINLRGFDSAAAPLPPGAALGQFMRALGADPQHIPTDLDEQAARYRTLLADKRVLILLDNAADTEQVRPLLPGSPTSLVVVTSRNQLTGLVIQHGAHRLTLDLLTPDEARHLLRQTVGADRVDREPDAAAHLIDLAARLPLALRILGERANRLPATPLADLVAELRAERDRLDVLDTEGDTATNLRAVFSYSYRALDPAAAQTFRLLGLNPGQDIGIPAASALTGESTSDTRRRLSALSRASLLTEHAAGRYTFHDLLRAYAGELAHELDTERSRHEALHRLLDFYLRTAHNAHRHLARISWQVRLDPPQPGVQPVAFTGHQHAVAWCEAERDNLMAATQCAADHGFHAHAWKIPGTLWEFYYLRKHWAHWIATHEVGLTAAAHLGDSDGQGRMLNGLGAAYGDQGQYTTALEYYERLLELAGTVGCRYAEGVALHNIGIGHRSLGKYVDALSYFGRALAIDREVGERNGEGIVLTGIGECYRNLGRHDEALHHYRQALAIHRETNEPRSEATALNGMGECFRDLGRHEDALAHFRHALANRRSTGDLWGVATTLSSMGHLHRITGSPDVARQCWHEALVLFQNLGDPRADEVRRHLTEHL